MDLLTEFVLLIKIPPYSSLFIILVSLFVSIFSAVATRKLTDQKKLIRYTREVEEFKLVELKALKTKNKKLLRFVNKNKLKFNKIQNELLFLRIKPQLFLFVPIVVVFFLMSGFFGVNDVVVAVLPFNLFEIFMQTEIPSYIVIHFHYFIPNFWSWYFMVNFIIRGFIQKISELSLKNS
ncbi:MAG: EMC3/TMCO1 family protein [Candidatus Hodarchaeales archaeon]